MIVDGFVVVSHGAKIGKAEIVGTSDELFPLKVVVIGIDNGAGVKVLEETLSPTAINLLRFFPSIAVNLLRFFPLRDLNK